MQSIPTIIQITHAGTFPPYCMTRIMLYFQIKHCDDLGIPADKSSTLYLFIGIFVALGRLGGGFLSDMKYIKTLRLFQVSTFIIGVSTMLLTLATTYAALVVYAITFSLADGMMVSTFFVECFESVAQSKRASVTGFIFVTGAAFFLGAPPLSGEYETYTYRRVGRLADEPRDGWTGRQTDRHSGRQAADRQGDGQENRWTGGWVGWRSSTQVRMTGKQADRHTDGRTDKQTDRQSDR